MKDITIFDKTQRGDYVPAKSLSEAGDALVEMDGIEVKRGTNVINDLLPGVTLTLKAPSPSPVELAIRHDAEGIKKQVLNLVGSYDGIITDIDVLTRKDDTVISDATYLSDDEKTKAKANLGLFVGDLSLSAAQGIHAERDDEPLPHVAGPGAEPARAGGHLHRHARPGLRPPSTARACAGTSRWTSRSSPRSIAAARGGAAAALRQRHDGRPGGGLAGPRSSWIRLLRPYVQTGGILPQRVTTLDTQIAASNRNIADYKVKLDDYQAELKRKYAQMGSALDNMQQNSQSIQNFNKQNRTGSKRRHAKVRLTINDEDVSYSLENEKTLGEVVHGIRAWLAAAGFVITALRADDRDLLQQPDVSWGSERVDAVSTLACRGRPHRGHEDRALADRGKRGWGCSRRKSRGRRSCSRGTGSPGGASRRASPHNGRPGGQPVPAARVRRGETVRDEVHGADRGLGPFLDRGGTP